MGKRSAKRAVRRADVLERMQDGHDDPREPWTTTELARYFDVSKQVIYDRLGELHELDEVETRKVGARARVWWVPADDADGGSA